MATSPKYRDDIKGNVKGAIADFEAGIRGELESTDTFILCVEDSGGYEEWKDYLTHAEMLAAFRRASRPS